MGDHTGVQLESRRLQSLSASGVAGVKDWHIILLCHGIDRCEQLDKIAVCIDIFLPMGREQNVLPLSQSQTLVDIARFDLVQIGVQYLGHGAAGHKGALLRQAALHQIPARVLRIAEIYIADDIHNASVRLLRQALVLAAVTRLHMENRNVQPFSADHRKAGVGVAQDQHRIRPDPHHQLVGLLDDIPNRGSEIIAYGIQIIVRSPETKIVKKHLIEGVVVVLTGVDQNLLKVPVAALYRGGQPDDFRPRTDNRHQLQLSHCYTSSK